MSGKLGMKLAMAFEFLICFVLQLKIRIIIVNVIIKPARNINCNYQLS